MLPQAAFQSHDIHRLAGFEREVLNDKREAKCSKAVADPTNDLGIGVGNAQDGLAEAPFGIEYPGEETCGPLPGWRNRPGYELANRSIAGGVRPDCVHGSPVAGGRLKQKSLSRNVKAEKIVARPYERLL